MKIRASFLNISQTRHFEKHFHRIISHNRRAPEVGLIRPSLHKTELLVAVPAHKRARVAGHATGGDKRFQAFLLAFCEGGGFASDECATFEG